MFGIGMPEMILIMAIALIVIGPNKLPDLAKSLGRALAEFKKATRELKDAIQMEEELDEVKTTFRDIREDITLDADNKTDIIDAAPVVDPLPTTSEENKISGADTDSKDVTKDV